MNGAIVACKLLKPNNIQRRFVKQKKKQQTKKEQEQDEYTRRMELEEKYRRDERIAENEHISHTKR